MWTCGIQACVFKRHVCVSVWFGFNVYRSFHHILEVINQYQIEPKHLKTQRQYQT